MVRRCGERSDFAYGTVCPTTAIRCIAVAPASIRLLNAGPSRSSRSGTAVGPSQGAAAAIAAAYDEFATVPLVDVEYFTLVDPATFRPVDTGFEGEARAILAAHVGSTRLLDNGPVRLGAA